MKVVTFNLRCGNDPNGNSIEERAPRLKAVMDRYDADLVGFQEVTPAWMEHLTADFMRSSINTVQKKIWNPHR